MGVDQHHLNQQAARFLEHKKRDQEVIDEFHTAGGYCYGYSTLYAFSHWVSARQRRGKIKTTKSIDNYDWFKKMSRLLDKWQPDKFTPAIEKDIERFIGLLRYHQKSHQFIGKTAGSQRDMDRYLQVANVQTQAPDDNQQDTITFTNEFSFTGNLTVKMLAQELQLLFKAEKVITVHSQEHATSIFCENEKLYFYNSNGEKGEVSTDSLLELAKIVYDGHTRFLSGEKPKAIPISIKIYDAPDPNHPTYYPNQRVMLETLDKVNTRLEIPYEEAAQMAFDSNDVHSFSYYLQKGLDIDSLSEVGDSTFLMRSIVRDYDTMFDVLLMRESKPNLEVKNSNDQTALFFTAIFARHSMMKKLLTLGADVTCRDSKGRTPLTFSVLAGDSKIVDILLDAGSDIDNQDNKKRTALMYAVVNEDEAMVKKLLERGADVDSKNHCGQTALMLAIKRKNKDMVKLLLDKGARVDLRDVAGFTPRMFVTYTGASELLPLIKKTGAQHTTLDALQLRLITALQKKDVNSFNQLTALYFDMNPSLDLTDPQHLFLLTSFFAYGQEKMGKSTLEKVKKNITQQQLDSMMEIGQTYFRPTEVEKLQVSLSRQSFDGVRPDWTMSKKVFPKSYTTLWRKQTDPIQATIRLMEDYYGLVKSLVHPGRKYQKEMQSIVNFCKQDPPPTPEQLKAKLLKMDQEHFQKRERETGDGQENRGAYRRRLNYCINMLDEHIKTNESSTKVSKQSAINSPRGITN